MNGMNLLGVAVGAVVVIALVFLLILLLYGKNMGGFSEKDYDERQQRARAISFKSGFYTLMISNALLGLSFAVLDPWCDMATGCFLSILAGVTVFASVSIMRDAYIPVRDNPRRTVILLGVIALINALCAMRYLLDPEETMIIDGLLTFRCGNLAITVMFVILFAVMLIKRGIDNREAEE